MLNNSTKKHSFWKSGYRNEIHPFKKTEKFINRNYRLWENPRFLIWQPFWPWLTSITSWNRVCFVFSILKDTSPPDQHFDTKLVVFNGPWAFLWSVSLPPISLFLNICVLQVADYLICGWSVWPGLMQIWPCPKVGARHFGRPHILPYPSKVKHSIRISVGPSALPDLPPTFRNTDKKAWSKTSCVCGWYTTLYRYQTYQ